MIERAPLRVVTVVATVVVASMFVGACSSEPDLPPAARGTRSRELGADSTARWLRGRPYHQDARALTLEQQKTFAAGAEVFQNPIRVTTDGARQAFSEPPGSPAHVDATGPTFVQSACMTCHVDGTEPEPVESPGPGRVVKVADANGAAVGAPHATLGHQLQDRSTDGSPTEGNLAIRWERLDGTLADGTAYQLQRPLGRVTDEPGGASAAPAISLRVAPPLLGLGLLEAIPRADLDASADPDDADHDGISGQVPRGRFGWKATQPTVRSQTVSALSIDMGVTTGEAPDPCNDRPSGCVATPGPRPELWGQPFDDLLLYTEAIAVPRARDLSGPEQQRGAQVFTAAGCAACHAPTQKSGTAPIAANANRTIHPYSDLLLHDLGPGLDDGVGEPGASTAEWRTAPLWGIGLRDDVYGGGHYLHDGRARSIEEAILWHGGEAAGARDRYAASGEDDRQALLTFLRAL
ncbi:MAG: di-heme oxidoredictase family protein [Acidimicrobiales bacterium]